MSVLKMRFSQWADHGAEAYQVITPVEMDKVENPRAPKLFDRAFHVLIQVNGMNIPDPVF